MTVGLPCKNPNCKSYGKPHPNCKCYGNMAEGGEVKHFCERNEVHQSGCEYFAEGGEVGQDNAQFPDPNDAVAGYISHYGATGLLNKRLNDPLEKYYSSIKKGHKSLEDSSESLFSDKTVPDSDNSKSKKTLEDWMNKGSVYDDIQNALSEGAVDPKSPLQNSLMATFHPEQNSLLQSAKGRVSGYLNSLKPQANAPKLSFDSEPDYTEMNKAYNKALDIANNPLSIMSDIKKGVIEPSQIKHLSMMYPELLQSLQKKVTDRIINAQLSGEKPDYKIRQGLSMLMGAPLSGDLYPPNMQAIQASFQKAQPQAQGQGSKPKKSTSKLSKSDQSYMTSNQALTGRQQKQ